MEHCPLKLLIGLFEVRFEGLHQPVSVRDLVWISAIGNTYIVDRFNEIQYIKFETFKGRARPGGCWLLWRCLKEGMVKGKLGCEISMILAVQVHDSSLYAVENE